MPGIFQIILFAAQGPFIAPTDGWRQTGSDLTPPQICVRARNFRLGAAITLGTEQLAARTACPLPAGRETHMALCSFIPWGPNTQTGGKLGQLKIGRVGNPAAPAEFSGGGECLFPHSGHKM